MTEKYKALEKTNKYLKNQRARTLLGMDPSPEFFWDEANQLADQVFDDREEFTRGKTLVYEYQHHAASCPNGDCSRMAEEVTVSFLNKWKKPLE